MNDELKRRCYRFPVLTKNDLNSAWNEPRKIKSNRRRSIFVVTMISTEDGALVWYCGARIYRNKYGVFKKFCDWLNFEKFEVSKFLDNELKSVGKLGTEKYFSSLYAFNLVKSLTTDEQSELIRMNPDVSTALIVPFTNNNGDNDVR